MPSYIIWQLCETAGGQTAPPTASHNGILCKMSLILHRARLVLNGAAAPNPAPRLLSASLRCVFARLPGAKKPVLMPRLPARVATACFKSPRRFATVRAVVCSARCLMSATSPARKPAKFFLRRLSRRGGSGVWRGGGCGLRRVYRAGWSLAGKRWARLRRAVFLLRPYGPIMKESLFDRKKKAAFAAFIKI